MTTNRKISLALAGVLAIPLGIGAFQAARAAGPAHMQTQQNAVTRFAPKQADTEKRDSSEVKGGADTEKPDAGEAKGGPDTDNIQAGPGNTSDSETNDGPDKGGDGESAGG